MEKSTNIFTKYSEARSLCGRSLEHYQDVVLVRRDEDLRLVGPHPEEAEVVDWVQVPHHGLGLGRDAAHLRRYIYGRYLQKHPCRSVDTSISM